MIDPVVRRRTMVEGQIRPNRVTDDRIADALLQVPRERFVPRNLRGVAYMDEEVPIGSGRYLLEPRVLARMLQDAAIVATDAVLDVGCATGYSTAVLARLAAAVVAVEQDEALADRAEALLTELEIDNAAVVRGPLADGYAAQAPYDVIFVGGATQRPLPMLHEQLAEGGRLLLIERAGRVGQAVIYRRSGDAVGRRVLFDAQVPVLPGFEAHAGFVF